MQQLNNYWVFLDPGVQRADGDDSNHCAHLLYSVDRKTDTLPTVCGSDFVLRVTLLIRLCRVLGL